MKKMIVAPLGLIIALLSANGVASPQEKQSEMTFFITSVGPGNGADLGGRAARASEARRLGERAGAPLLTMTRTAYDETGRAVEYGSHLYRASRFTFELTLTSG
jgi:hypothetical protein